MNSHVSAILLGVNDMERSKRFYTEGLGWEIQDDWKISVFFVPHGGSLVGFYGRDGLGRDGWDQLGRQRLPLASSSTTSCGARHASTRSWTKPSGRRDILKPAGKLHWGGYGGTFVDPDGYVCSIGYSAAGKDQPYPAE